MKRNWFSNVFQGSSRARRERPGVVRGRPRLESLEDRTVPTTINLAGTAGNDTFLFSVSGGTIRYTDQTNSLIDTGVAPGADVIICVDGKAGNDTIDLSKLSAAEHKGSTLIGGDGSDTLIGGVQGDTISGGNDNDLIQGGDGADVLNGEDGNDNMQGGAGNDTLNGGDKGDDMFGGAGDDSLNGDAGEDWMEGNQDNDTLNGGTEHDFLMGGIGNDVVNGDDDADNLYGNDGNDSLNGGAGPDLLQGGAGADAQNGGASEDSYLLGAGEGDGDTFSDPGGIDTIINIGGGSLTLTNLTAASGIDAIDTAGAIVGSGAANSLDFSNTKFVGVTFVDGGAGDDTLVGTSGNDDLRGGAGNDSITGGAGNDSIEDGVGNSTLDGGAGADIFLFRQPTGNERNNDVTLVNGFVRGTTGDKIRVLHSLVNAGSFNNTIGSLIQVVNGNTEFPGTPDGPLVRLVGYSGGLDVSDFILT